MAEAFKLSVSVKDTEIFISLGKLIIEVSRDERIPFEVRNEIIDKANKLLEEK